MRKTVVVDALQIAALTVVGAGIGAMLVFGRPLGHGSLRAVAFLAGLAATSAVELYLVLLYIAEWRQGGVERHVIERAGFFTLLALMAMSGPFLFFPHSLHVPAFAAFCFALAIFPVSEHVLTKTVA
jgi:hypothetical protein